MTSTVLVCDEMQLIGDEHRGQNVEVLLTLARNAGWKQFVGLSAVLDRKDAQDLADWLGVTLVAQHSREKHLRYECWTPKGIAAVASHAPDDIQEALPVPTDVGLAPLSILDFLLKEKSPPVPIIVFCMRKQDTYDLAEQFLAGRRKGAQLRLSLAFDDLPETAANKFLAGAVTQRVAIHNADLTDEEREVVEEHLLGGKLDVVFATSTLAAGVNFPLGAAIFASWHRWDFDRRENVAIESAEFHNMAGRVGRMGFEHVQGRVIFGANSEAEIRSARRYLNLGAMPSIESRIAPERFNQLALQLVASGLCNSRNGVERVVFRTFSPNPKIIQTAKACATRS
jgi:helicase